MKVCIKCKQSKEDEQFSFKVKSRGIRSGTCKECSKIYTLAHYKANKQVYVNRAKVFNKQQRKENRELLNEFLRTKCCVDCGNKDVRVFEFDHKPEFKKRWNIGDVIGRYNWKTVLSEIEKCDVRCANCHRIKTYERFSWNKISRSTCVEQSSGN